MLGVMVSTTLHCRAAPVVHVHVVVEEEPAEMEWRCNW
jgi:hypothetical protein